MYKNQGLTQDELRAKWLEHAPEWFSPTNAHPERTERHILELFGPPPYRFLAEDDPAPAQFVTRRVRPRLNTAHRFPAPGYRNLPSKAEFVETTHSLHVWRGSGALLAELAVSELRGDHPIQISRTRTINSGRQLLFVRLPIASKRAGFRFPYAGETLSLVHSETGVACTARVRSTQFPDRRSTGWMIVENFVCN